MKKFIFSLVMMMAMFISANAQSNYAGSSKFTDNVSVTLQGGVLTTFNDFYAGHTAMAPVGLIAVDKYITPAIGVGVEARTLIGTGKVNEARFNTKTMFDAVNVSGLVKFNLVNMFDFDGTRKTFEPVAYTGLGWGHQTATSYNYMTYRAGLELNYNLGKNKAWGIVVNPSVVWGDYPANGALCKSAGNFEVTAGVVYHFKTSNGTRSFTKAHLYDANEVAALNARIAELEARKPQIIEKIIENAPTATHAVASTESTYSVSFNQNTAELSYAAKEILNTVPTNVTVNVAGSTSPEGTVARNTALAIERANAVADYLRARGVNVNTVSGGDAGRAAVITIQK